jgi:hypothetical protein
MGRMQPDRPLACLRGREKERRTLLTDAREHWTRQLWRDGACYAKVVSGRRLSWLPVCPAQLLQVDGMLSLGMIGSTIRTRLHPEDCYHC